MKTDIADLLRSMPDLEPPAGVWQRIVARHSRRDLVRWRGRFAVAASVAVAIIAGYWSLRSTESGWAPTMDSTAALIVDPIIVSAPAIAPDLRAVDAEVRSLQRRSQYMERVLGELPRRGKVARADAAGVIAELEDRIAAVDYQLNRSGLSRAGLNRTAIGARRAGGSGYRQTDAPDLWRRRVEFMDQLVRARYAETGVGGF